MKKKHNGTTLKKIVWVIKSAISSVFCVTSYKKRKLKIVFDKPHNRWSRNISGEDCVKVTGLTCSKAPEGYSQWSHYLLADKLVELEYVENFYESVGRGVKLSLLNS